MNPNDLRNSLCKVREDLGRLEAELNVLVGRGVTAAIEVSHEMVEANDALDRAVEILDQNYKGVN